MRRELCVDVGCCALGVGPRRGDGRELGHQPLESSAELLPLLGGCAHALVELTAF